MNVNLTWSPVTQDDTGASLSIVKYNVYRDGSLIGGPGGALYTDNNVTPGTHTYTVSAVASGTLAEGAQSMVATVTIPSGIPAAPTGLVAVAV